MKNTYLILASMMIWVSGLFSQELPKEIDFTLPLGVDHKVEEKEGRFAQCFRLQIHPNDPDYWGIDLPTLVLYPVSKGEYLEAIADFTQKTGGELEKEILSQVPDDPSISSPSVKVANFSCGGANGYSVYMAYTVSTLDMTMRTYSIWFKLDETYWVGSGVSLLGDQDISSIEAILASLRLKAEK